MEAILAKSKPLLTDILREIGRHADPETRARACCEADLIGDNARSRAMLASCCEGDGFYQTLARERHATLERPRKVRRQPSKKPYVAPNRLPSLFAD